MFNFTAEFTNIDCFIKTINRINHRLILYAKTLSSIFILIDYSNFSDNLYRDDEAGN